MTQIALQHPQSIVVATDFSPPANLAVEQAARLAKGWDAALHILHAGKPDDEGGLSLARSRLEKQQESLVGNPGIRTSGVLRTGRASVEIIRLVNDVGADLVVVGEHSQGWLKDRFLGGTALKVLRQARVPVLLIRTSVSSEFRKITVATDFSDNAQRAAQVAAGFFPQAELTFQHACSLQQLHRMRLDGETPEKMAAYRQQQIKAANTAMAHFRKQLGLPAEQSTQWQVVSDGENPISILLDRVQKDNPDLLVVGRHGGSEIDERFFGSATENLLYHAQTNILLVP
ncbi:MAG: universal stress protein [Azonexus sp.]